MPDFLALDWENHQLCGLEGQISAGSVRVKNCFQLKWPDDIDPAEQPEQAGEWLGGELRRLGISSTQVLVSLPREDAVVRQLELPAAPNEELPDLVRFQAATKSSSPLDQLLLDFLPLPVRDVEGGRDVLMATISTAMADRMQKLTTAAGLELKSIGISSVATVEFIARLEKRRGDDPGETSLLIARHEQRVELSIVRDRHLLFSHSTLLAGDGTLGHDQSILAEISRSLVAMERLHPGIRIARTWVVGTEEENQSLCEAIRDRLSSRVQTADPLTDSDAEYSGGEIPGSRALYAGPVGMLLSQAGQTVESIDFLNPRKPPVPVQLWKERAKYIGAAVVLIAVVGIGGLVFHVRGLDQQIGIKREQEQRMSLQVKNDQPLVDSAAVIDEWVAGNVNWLDQMQKGNRALPGTDRIYLTEYRFDPATGDAIARIHATGKARSRLDVELLNQQLVDRKFRLHPQPITQSLKDADYQHRFELNFELVSASASKQGNKAKQPNSARTRRRRSR